MQIEVTINGQWHSVEVAPGEVLLDVLRRLGFKGVKEGCREGQCGVCMVLLDGQPVNSCLVLAPKVHKRELITGEGLGSPSQLHPIQEAFIESGAIQCGYCTSGFIISAYTLLQENPDPNEKEIKEALDSNLCRCTGYTKILDAVKIAAKKLSTKKRTTLSRPNKFQRRKR